MLHLGDIRRRLHDGLGIDSGSATVASAAVGSAAIATAAAVVAGGILVEDLIDVDEGVVAVLLGEVVPAAAVEGFGLAVVVEEDVVAVLAAAHGIFTDAAVDVVVAAVADERVVAVFAEDDVVAGRADDRIVPLAADDGFDGGVGHVEGDAGGQVGKVGRVEPRAAAKRVIPAAADEQVIAAAAAKRIVAASADDRHRHEDLVVHGERVVPAHHVDVDGFDLAEIDILLLAESVENLQICFLAGEIDDIVILRAA